MVKKLLLSTIITANLYGLSGIEVAKRSYDVMSGYKSSISLTTMILKNKNGQKNVRKLEIKKLENSSGDKSLITFLYPNDIKDTKLLSHEKIAKDDHQWLYLPALKRIKRISSRNKSGSFMASEFSYEDISSQNYKNYSYERVAKKVIKRGKEYYEVIRFPKDKNSGYSKQIIYLDSKSFLAHFGEYFDKQKRLLKKVEFMEYHKIQGVYRIKKIKMINVQNGKSSMLIWDKDTINQSIDAKAFTKRALQ